MGTKILDKEYSVAVFPACRQEFADTLPLQTKGEALKMP